MKKSFFYAAFFLLLIFPLLFSCASTPKKIKNDGKPEVTTDKNISEPEKDTILLTFAGDIMAHTPNHKISSYQKIWEGVKIHIEEADLSFANIESPIDSTKPVSSYPNFNLPQSYVQAAIDAGFNVFSLSNNHSFDQFESGIAQTIISAENLTKKNAEDGKKIWFSGLKEHKGDSYSYSIIEKNGWKILFLPVTGILNYPHDTELINYVKTSEKSHKEFLEFCKKLRKENPCDLFIISMHADEPEYKRKVEKSQRNFYLSLLETADVIWANHAHIVKDREFIFDSESGKEKVIMYANGNTISAQRTSPDFESYLPLSERDNTGDGLLYKITFFKTKNAKKCYNEKGEPEIPVQIKKAEPVFITTYINTAWEFILKPMDREFIEYLNDVGRKNWATYIEKRIKINTEQTKDLVTWQ